MDRNKMIDVIVDFIAATDPSPFNPVMEKGDYMEIVAWNNQRRYEWVASAPLEWLDVALDVAVNPPDLSRYSLRGDDDWDFEIDELLGAWGQHNPRAWAQKVGPLLQNEKARPIALSAMANVGRGSELFLSWLRPLAQNPAGLSPDELLDLVTTIGQAQSTEGYEILEEMRERIPPEQGEVLKEIDLFLNHRMDDTPNYSLYSLPYLQDVARHLDKEKYPERHVLVMQEIQKREIQEGERLASAQANVKQAAVAQPAAEPPSLFQGCLFALLRFCGGALVGGIGAIILWQIIYPPSGPGYGDGIGYGMAMLFWAFLAAIAGGVFAMFYKLGSK